MDTALKVGTFVLSFAAPALCTLQSKLYVTFAMEKTSMLEEEPSFFTVTSAVSLLAVLLLLSVAYGASNRYLPRNAPTTIRALAIWHLFDVRPKVATLG
jgi:hypothetical protein